MADFFKIYLQALRNDFFSIEGRCPGLRHGTASRLHYTKVGLMSKTLWEGRVRDRRRESVHTKDPMSKCLDPPPATTFGGEEICIPIKRECGRENHGDTEVFGSNTPAPTPTRQRSVMRQPWRLQGYYQFE
jgi:hypothetical protein